MRILVPYNVTGQVVWMAGALLSAVLLAAPAAFAEPADPFLLHDGDGLVVRGHLQLGVNAVTEQNLFWNFSGTFAPDTGFDPDTEWIEGYLKPGLSFERSLDDGLTIYGKASLVASGTLGTDAFDTGDTGGVTLEEGYLGLRFNGVDGPGFDLSAGPREFTAGTGMLIANGGSSGFDRGALKLGPHKAWAVAALGRLSWDKVTTTAFYLDANEAPDSDTGTRIVGVDLRYQPSDDSFAGVTAATVVASSAPYPKAAPGGVGVPSILPGARDGLRLIDLYGRTRPFDGALKNLFMTAELALERNDDIDLQAWAGRIQIGYVFADRPWSPTLVYSYQTFSGDDPSTSRLERFDPLYYEGSPSAWSTGSKSSMVFINSNVASHQISLRLSPTPRDTLTLRYAHILADQLRSPIQYGQATRVDVSDGGLDAIAGVTAHHLSDDLFLEYIRVLRPNLYLTAGISVSIPGAGVDSIVNANAPSWTGAFVNLVADF